MERGVFPVPEIRERLRRFVLVKLLVDHPDPAKRSEEWLRLLKTEFRTSAIPLYATYDPEGRVTGTLTFPGGGASAFVDPMAAFLDAALAK